MVGDEADRAHEHARHSTRVKAVELGEDVRPEPRLAGRALALEGERPALETGRLDDQLRGLEELVTVRVALVEDPRRKAVRSEDDVGVRSTNAVGEHRDVRLVRMPALDEAKLGATVKTGDPLVTVYLPEKLRGAASLEDAFHETIDITRARKPVPKLILEVIGK